MLNNYYWFQCVYNSSLCSCNPLSSPQLLQLIKSSENWRMYHGRYYQIGSGFQMVHMQLMVSCGSLPLSDIRLSQNIQLRIRGRRQLSSFGYPLILMPPGGGSLHNWICLKNMLWQNRFIAMLKNWLVWHAHYKSGDVPIACMVGALYAVLCLVHLWPFIILLHANCIDGQFQGLLILDI